METQALLARVCSPCVALVKSYSKLNFVMQHPDYKSAGAGRQFIYNNNNKLVTEIYK